MNKNNFPVPVYAIVAIDEERAIGRGGDLPWHLPDDLKNFARLTKNQTVLMGRKTFDSLPEKYRPLPQRLNIVLSRSASSQLHSDVRNFQDLAQVADFCSQAGNLRGDALWVIGGEQIFRLTEAWWDRVYLTRVKGTYNGDVFFPLFENDYNLIENSPGEGCDFEVYERK